jgi:polysaccharide biosynthesis protein VpsM
MRSYIKGTQLSAVSCKVLWTAMAMIMTILPAGQIISLHAEGLELGRFRITPILTIVQRYSDNIYLEETDEEDDFYTEISPEITLDFALAPRNYLSLNYRGNFYRFNSADNFNTEHHRGELSWNMETTKGSTFRAGTRLSESSVQPYSATGTSRDYKLRSYFGNFIIAAGASTEVGAGYERVERRFDEDIFQDDYDRDQIDLSVVFGRSRIWPLLFQYRFVRQDNEDFFDFNRDFETHALYTGARWHPAGKVSGALRVGYTWSDFDNPEIDDFSGFGMDINVLYRITEITRLSLIGQRYVSPVTIAERDSGSYYILTSGGVRLSHHRWEKIITRLNYTYHYRDYQPGPLQLGERVDREHVIELMAEYVMRQWITFSAGYRYRDNDSDIDPFDYKENLFHLGVTLSI